jgi:hypothetical protein
MDYVQYFISETPTIYVLYMIQKAIQVLNMVSLKYTGVHTEHCPFCILHKYCITVLCYLLGIHGIPNQRMYFLWTDIRYR